MGFWSKIKAAFSGGKTSQPGRDAPASGGDAGASDSSASEANVQVSTRNWALTKRGSHLVLEAPHGVFPVKAIAAQVQQAFLALPEGALVNCRGHFASDGPKNIETLVVTEIKVTAPASTGARVAANGPKAAAAAAAAPAAPAAPTATPTAPALTPLQLAHRAAKTAPPNISIMGLSAQAMRERGLKINPYRTPWIGRVDTIPPQSDERTALIDRGLILRGLLTESEISEIHSIGDEWLATNEARQLAATVAAQARRAAVEAQETAKADRQRLRAEKRTAAATRRAALRDAIVKRRATDIRFLGRGVSHFLNDRRTNIEALTAAQLPVLCDPQELAIAMGLTVSQLRFLAYSATVTSRPHYVYFDIAKRSGGSRRLAAPHRKLANAQSWIRTSIIEKLPVSTHAHGFVAKRSTVTNATPHVGQSIVVNLDLKDFFPTITLPRVRGLFQSFGYSPAVASILALLTTEFPRMQVMHHGKPSFVAAGARCLPQGACTSPGISNLVCRKLDRRLAGAAAKLGWIYTRYADDVTFSASGEAAKAMSLMMSRVRAILRDEGFVVNEAKGSVARRGARQLVTGIVVNDKTSVPRSELRRIRAILHQAKGSGLAAQNRDNRPDFEAWLSGKIAYIHMVDPTRGAELRAALQALSSTAVK